MTHFRDKPLDERKALVKAMVARMAEAYKIKKSQLAAQLGCSPGVINSWVYYGRTPFEYLVRCKEETGVSVDWLLFGSQPAKQLTRNDIETLKTIQAKVLEDGIKYAMISEQYQGALNQLSTKYSDDIDCWAEHLSHSDENEVNGKD